MHISHQPMACQITIIAQVKSGYHVGLDKSDEKDGYDYPYSGIHSLKNICTPITGHKQESGAQKHS